MSLALRPPEWVDEAACTSTDPDLFFPTQGGDTRSAQLAKAICAECPVLAQCLAYAVEDPSVVGIWGGTTLLDRQRIRRDKGLARVGGGTTVRCRNGHARSPEDRGGCEQCRVESRKRYEARKRARRQETAA
jgi:WhiB family redox-sensing transcriptional regulator